MIFLACLVPIAVYCLVLAIINRRRHPVIVSGPWDFAGVLFAASGILLLGGPAILTGLYEQWRLSRLLGQTRYLQSIGDQWSFWISVWLLYFLVVAGGSAIILWRRRRLTSIYRVEPEAFTEVLTQVLDRLGMEWLRNGPRRLLVRCPTKRAGASFSPDAPLLEAGNEFLGSIPIPHRSPASSIPVIAEDAASYPERTAVTARSTSDLAYPWAELDLHPFPAMHHMTVAWRGQDEAIRLEIESELAKALAQVRTRRNPLAAWFLSLALGLFFSAFAGLLALIVIRILRLPRY